MTKDYEDVEIARKEKPDVRFRGKLLGEIESRKPGSRADRYTKLELWELASGAWVAAAVGCSDRDGEIDIGDVALIEPRDKDAGEAEREAMQFWGWSWLAKEMAEKLGWDVVDEII